MAATISVLVDELPRGVRVAMEAVDQDTGMVLHSYVWPVGYRPAEWEVASVVRMLEEEYADDW